MGGGLLQLIAIGAQDAFLTGNPQITFFKTVYRRHTNFALESIEQTFDGTPAYGAKVSISVAKSGDLISRMYIEHNPILNGAMTSYDHYGHNILKEMELQINGNRVDRQYSQWLQVWNELSNPDYKMRDSSGGDSDNVAADEDAIRYSPEGYMRMVGDHALVSTSTERRLYIPLQFWFCRNPGLALPLIALQHHEVKVLIEFQSAANSGSSSHTFGGASLWIDYIFIDTDERRKFAQKSHEYLIEQVQFTGSESVTAITAKKIDLNFNHPVKELIWVVATDILTNNMKFLNLSGSTGAKADACSGTGTTAGTCKVKVQLNGTDRFSERKMTYFTRVQPYQHHTNMPIGDRIGVYSFALSPEEHQPSGTCNFSRIDNIELHITPAQTGQLYVFATNYNILRIHSGMGAIAFGN